MEIRDLYDENKIITGETMIKGENVPYGRYYITVVIFIQNENEEFLMQKRVLRKDGKWSTTGGHVVTGETSLCGIIREVKEELGIELNSKIELIHTIKTEDDFVDIYYTKSEIDTNKIVLQKEEVDDAKFMSISEINKLIEEEKFSESHKEFLNICITYLKDR